MRADDVSEILQKKIEEGQKLILHAIQRFPESTAFFTQIFENIEDENEIDSLISDYVLDIKSENSKEFKTDQIPENSPNILKMAEQKTDNTQNINEEPETVTDDADDDTDDDVIDNSPDKELVIKAVNDITGLYLEYTMYKTKKDDRYKEVFNEIISKTSNFKFTTLFKAKLINRIEKITVSFHKRRLSEDQDLFVREGDFILYGENYYEILTLVEPKWLFGQVESRFEISAECVRAREGLFDAG